MVELDRKLAQELNSQTIHQALKRLLDENPVIKNGEWIDLSISLVEGSFALAYLMERFYEPMALPFRVETHIVDLGKEISIAEREYQFYPRKNNKILIHSYSETEPDHQSKGYGTGLFKCTPIIMEDVVKRVPELRGKRLVSEISDAAEENGARNGWTSYQAQALGYKRKNQFHWQKQF
ncbi:MAG: hypothetical protein ABIC96_01970 [Patescibacteria group bacterium]